MQSARGPVRFLIKSAGRALALGAIVFQAAAPIAQAQTPGAAALSQTSSTSAAGTATPAPTPLTIDDAAAFALQHNPALAAAQAEADRQMGVVAQAKTGLRPAISGVGTATHTETEQFAYLGSDPLALSRRDALFFGVNGTLPVDISGVIHTAVSQAQFQALAARFALAAARNNVAATTRDGYYAALRAGAVADSARQDLANAQDRLNETQLQVNAGSMARFELERAKTAVAAAQNIVFTDEQNADLALAQLRQLMGMEQNQPLSVTASGAEEDSREPAPQAGPESGSARPEVLQAEAALMAAEKGIKLAKQTMKPSFSVGAGVGHTPDGSAIGEGINSAQISANLTIPLYDAGIARAQTEQAAASKASAQDQLTAVRQQVDFEIRQANVKLANATARLPIAETALADAQESYRLAKMRFTEGESPQVEVTDAQGALTQAQLDLINAHWDLLAARNEYNKAIGLYSYRTDK